jgi:DNA repair exonuclease SbcCD ATPase subunit
VTAEPIISRGVRLPRPESLRLEHFSLYSREPDIEVVFNEGVSCLAGANGLGKSTFLAALNFAITGIVAEPDRRFGELSRWYKDSQPYSASFFKGRIRDEDRDLARITVVLRVGDRRYTLSRSPFEPTALSALDITSDDADDVLQAAADEDLSDAARHDLYAKAVTQDCGLDNFPQLVFLQHFVLTFDEQRRLIFWDEDLARTAMYIVFGIDPRRAHRADTLVSKISKADSRARNLQWQSSDLRRQLDNLTKTGAQAAEGEMSSEIDERHRELMAEQQEAGKVVERLAGELTDARLRVAQRSGELRSTRQEYDSLWQQRLHGHGHPKSHPLITTTIASNRCAVCGSEDGAVVESITQALNANRCPLCESELTRRGGAAPEDTAARMAKVDAEIVALQESIAATEHVIGETSSKLEAARADLERLSQELAEYASANELALARATGASGGIDAVAERYKAQMADLQARKRTEIEHRNRDRAELTTLQSELVGAYARAEQLFVPDFTELAQAFLGLDLSIEMQARSSGPNLIGSFCWGDARSRLFAGFWVLPGWRVLSTCRA